MVRMGLRLVRAFLEIESIKIFIHLQQLAIDCSRLLSPRFLITRGSPRHLGAAVIDVLIILYQTESIAQLYLCIWPFDSYG